MIDFQGVQMSNERLLCMPEFVAACALMKQPAHRIVRHHPAVELSAHQIRRFAAPLPPALAQVRLHLIKHRLDLPALVLQPDQLLNTGRRRIH